MSISFKWVKENKKKAVVLFSLVFFFSIISFSVYAVSREVGDLRSFAQYATGVRPSCTRFDENGNTVMDHNLCPPNWMYCVGGECYSYSMTGAVGRPCNTTRDCKNGILNCVDGVCQRVTGEPGGCISSMDCVEQYRGVDDGRWACTNGQCLKLAQTTTQYFRDGQWHSYGTSPACILNSDCPPEAVCDEYGCHWRSNQEPCEYSYQCGALPSDPNKVYRCGEGGKCVAKDACEVMEEIFGGCGPGLYCKAFTNPGGSRSGRCYPEDGTTSAGGLPPACWQMDCQGKGRLIEGCDDTAKGSQRIRYCSNEPESICRWNGWIGPSNERCIEGGELWGSGSQSWGDLSVPGAPDGFFSLTDKDGRPRCEALGTLIVRCSNVNEGELVSYCATDQYKPWESAIRWPDWKGSNGEYCTTSGMVVPPGAQTNYSYLQDQGGSGGSMQISERSSFSPATAQQQAPQFEEREYQAFSVGDPYYEDYSYSEQTPQGTAQGATQESSSFLTRFLSLVTSAMRPNPEVCEGDVNGDGVVNKTDFNILMDNWYSTDTNIYINGNFVNIDLNNDGIIDILDVNVVLNDWGCVSR